MIFSYSLKDTSGTTDKPKGIQRPTGGYLVTLMYTMRSIYGLTPDDVWWYVRIYFHISDKIKIPQSI